ncbi:MAG: hypothetical protein HUK21_02945 [Fibrobacteraceae bacterium]|nr:hypothetical protein [Fibrobacteraceae bacterium]
MKWVKETILKVIGYLVGKKKVHHYLIGRGIKLRNLQSFYSSKAPKTLQEETKSTLIFMVDGKCLHGGIADRFKGMLSAYAFAKKHNLEFRIHHIFPFPLEQIFLSSQYQWQIAADKISYNSDEAKPILLYREDYDTEEALLWQIKSRHKQYHLYSCAACMDTDYNQAFHELFEFQPFFQNILDQYKAKLGGAYTAVSFRFQNLFGDFPEWKFQPLTSDLAKKDLLERALEALQQIQKNNHGNKILVTADSTFFLKHVARIEKVVTVQGESVHIDFPQKETSVDPFLKSLVEFFLISKAQQSTLYRDLKYNTYPSGFPEYAAKLGNIPFKAFCKS